MWGGINLTKTFTDAYLERLLIMASSVIKSANITVSGQTDNYPITKTVIEDNFYKHYFEIGSEPIGIIERAEAVDENGIVMWEKDYEIDKDDNGWHIAVKVAIVLIEEEEV